jgi:hypothetical protein
MLFFGEVLKPEYRGSQIGKIGGQTDLAKTLLNQLGMESQNFKWSKDLFHEKSMDFAFYSWDNGFGWVDKQQYISFDNVGKNVISQKGQKQNSSSKPILKQGKAYLQSVYQEYLDY